MKSAHTIILPNLAYVTNLEATYTPMLAKNKSFWVLLHLCKSKICASGAIFAASLECKHSDSALLDYHEHRRCSFQDGKAVISRLRSNHFNHSRNGFYFKFCLLKYSENEFHCINPLTDLCSFPRFHRILHTTVFQFRETT